ncbi:MAG TPA: helix-turn-helix domain-containing protein [Kofleriaceae bacterium]|nr:helix-turn-helix domain-containing protein [Kofleriaceae bacterium]
MERRSDRSDTASQRPSSETIVDVRTSLALWLRAGRTQRGMSLEQVAKVTKIQPRILERLEAGRLDGLPAEVFVRGFVRSFARCVGLDEDEALRRYAACGAGTGAAELTPTVRALVEAMVDLTPGHAAVPRATPRRMDAVQTAPAVEIIDLSPSASSIPGIPGIRGIPGALPRAMRESGAVVETMMLPETGTVVMPAQLRAQVTEAATEAARGALVAPARITRVMAAVVEPAVVEAPVVVVPVVAAPVVAPVEPVVAGVELVAASAEPVACAAVTVELAAAGVAELPAEARVEALARASIEAPVGASIEALVGALVGAPIEALVGAPDEVRAEALVETPVEAPKKKRGRRGGKGRSKRASAGGMPAAPRTSLATGTPPEASPVAVAAPDAGPALGVNANEPTPVTAVAVEDAVSLATDASAVAIPVSLAAPATAVAPSIKSLAEPSVAPQAEPRIDLFAAPPLPSRDPAPVAPATAVAPGVPGVDEPIVTATWSPKMPPIATTASVPWRRPAYVATPTAIVPSLVIDDADPDSAERVLEERAEKHTPRRSFLPPILLDREDRSGRQGGLTLAVIILLIAATLTLSYLMRRPSAGGDGMTRLDTPATVPVAVPATVIDSPATVIDSLTTVIDSPAIG